MSSDLNGRYKRPISCDSAKTSRLFLAYITVSSVPVNRYMYVHTYIVIYKLAVIFYFAIPLFINLLQLTDI